MLNSTKNLKETGAAFEIRNQDEHGWLIVEAEHVVWRSPNKNSAGKRMSLERLIEVLNTDPHTSEADPPGRP